METFTPLLAIYAGNSPATGELPAQRPVKRTFDVFFDLHLNKRLSKQWWGWWFETLSCPLWRHRHEEPSNRRLFCAANWRSTGCGDRINLQSSLTRCFHLRLCFLDHLLAGVTLDVSGHGKSTLYDGSSPEWFRNVWLWYFLYFVCCGANLLYKAIHSLLYRAYSKMKNKIKTANSHVCSC